MFSMKDIANLKEVIHNQGSWDNHTSILIEHSDSKIIKDESAIIHYAKMLSDVISIQKPGKCYIAQRIEAKEYSMFQLVENSCIAGDISLDKPKSSVEIFTSKNLNLEEVLRITKEFFDTPFLEVTTFLKVAN